MCHTWACSMKRAWPAQSQREAGIKICNKPALPPKHAFGLQQTARRQARAIRSMRAMRGPGREVLSRKSGLYLLRRFFRPHVQKKTATSKVTHWVSELWPWGHHCQSPWAQEPNLQTNGLFSNTATKFSAEAIPYMIIIAKFQNDHARTARTTSSVTPVMPCDQSWILADVAAVLLAQLCEWLVNVVKLHNSSVSKASACHLPRGTLSHSSKLIPKHDCELPAAEKRCLRGAALAWHASKSGGSLL